MAQEFSAINSKQPPIVDFYDPDVAAPDSRGRYLSTILHWDNARLESCHNYIQILFPVPEYSIHNSAAPLLNRATFDAFRSRPELRNRLEISFTRILAFFGFRVERNGGSFMVVPSENFAERSATWDRPSNHNHLRMSRIIRSLRILGLEREAEAFYLALGRLEAAKSRRFSQSSLKFWNRAARNPLYLSPDLGTDIGTGQAFLYEYENRAKSSETIQGYETERPRNNEGKGVTDKQGEEVPKNSDGHERKQVTGEEGKDSPKVNEGNEGNKATDGEEEDIAKENEGNDGIQQEGNSEADVPLSFTLDSPNSNAKRRGSDIANGANKRAPSAKSDKSEKSEPHPTQQSTLPRTTNREKQKSSIKSQSPGKSRPSKGGEPAVLSEEDDEAKRKSSIKSDKSSKNTSVKDTKPVLQKDPVKKISTPPSLKAQNTGKVKKTQTPRTPRPPVTPKTRRESRATPEAPTTRERHPRKAKENVEYKKYL
ncbi:hypothetical protein MMC12_003482 [Toensbergia leucococca]|nr:hypothetical protein [Toensbergia leucococca]